MLLIMSKKLKILIIEDHPLIREAYKSACLQVSKQDDNFEFKIDSADTSDDALKKINEASKNGGVDIIFLDIRLPPSIENLIFTGEDLGLHIRERLPDAKIIISTTFNDNYRIHSIITNINPEGFLIKSDLTASELSSAFQRILNRDVFYSGTVNSILNKTIPHRLDVDSINHEILYLLSKGTKTKDIAKHLELSLSTVEKRKKTLKILFRVEDGNDQALVEEAKNKGFINK